MATETYVIKGSKPVIEKDPDALLDYAFDWTAYLLDISDTIASAQFIVDPTLVLDHSAFDAHTATAWVGGGVAPAAGGYLRVTCRITTAGGRTDDRSIYLKITER